MAIDPRPPVHRPSVHRPPVHRSTSALAAIALAAALTTIACGGAAGPASHPETAPAADSVPPGGTETAPVNASPEARVPAPRTSPPAPEVEPRSEWTIDESIETPEALRGLEILAKFKKGDDVVIIYRAKNGDVYRRVEGRLGTYSRVEESKIELEP